MAMQLSRAWSPHGSAAPAWRRLLLLTSLGSLALFMGLLVYGVDRGWALQGHRLFGTIGEWLPSFVHALAFSLFTAAVLQPSPAAGLGACAFWATVNVAFECGQHAVLKPVWQEALRNGAGDGVLVRPLLNYLAQGTFDPHDVCAALFGALVAGATLHVLDSTEDTPHEPN